MKALAQTSARWDQEKRNVKNKQNSAQSHHLLEIRTRFLDDSKCDGDFGAPESRGQPHRVRGEAWHYRWARKNLDPRFHHPEACMSFQSVELFNVRAEPEVATKIEPCLESCFSHASSLAVVSKGPRLAAAAYCVTYTTAVHFVRASHR